MYNTKLSSCLLYISNRRSADHRGQPSRTNSCTLAAKTKITDCISTLIHRVRIHRQRRRPLRRSNRILKLILPPLDCRVILLKQPETRQLLPIAQQRADLVRLQSILRARLLCLKLPARDPRHEELRSFWSRRAGKDGSGLRTQQLRRAAFRDNGLRFCQQKR
jgi:hypothetical protein